MYNQLPEYEMIEWKVHTSRPPSWREQQRVRVAQMSLDATRRGERFCNAYPFAIPPLMIVGGALVILSGLGLCVAMPVIFGGRILFRPRIRSIALLALVAIIIGGDIIQGILAIT